MSCLSLNVDWPASTSKHTEEFVLASCWILELILKRWLRPRGHGLAHANVLRCWLYCRWEIWSLATRPSRIASWQWEIWVGMSLFAWCAYSHNTNEGSYRESFSLFALHFFVLHLCYIFWERTEICLQARLGLQHTTHTLFLLSACKLQQNHSVGSCVHPPFPLLAHTIPSFLPNPTWAIPGCKAGLIAHLQDYMYHVTETAPLPNGMALWVLDLKGAALIILQPLSLRLLQPPQFSS